MTQAPLELQDPGAAFLASGDPEAFLRDNLPFTPPPSEDDTAEESDFLKAVVIIAGSYMAWRLYAIAKARREMPGPPPDPEGALHLFFTRHAPMWMRVTQPAIAQVMASQGLTGPELTAVAADYAARLGQQVHATSANAVVAGYREQLRRGVSPTLSWLRAMEGYGLDERRLRSWVAQQAVQEGPISDLIRPGARRALERAMLARADVLGQTEAWHAREVAKSIVWLYEEQAGQMPYGTRKRWITADDELVCKVCGPLHKREVRLSEQFTLPNGQRLWAPGVHPNCRCELALVYPEINVEKALGDDPYDRDSQGQFARKESRVKRVARPMPVKERDTNEAAAMFERARQEQVEEVPDLFGTKVPDLFGTQSSPPDLFGAQAPTLFAPPPTLFGAPDLFAPGDIFAPQGSKMKTTGRRRRIYIIVNGQLQEVDAEEVAPDDDHWVFLPADAYFAQKNEYKPERAGEPAVGVPELRTGVVLDFDEMAAEAAYEKHKVDRSVPMPIQAHQGRSPVDMIRRLDDFYHYTDDLVAEDQTLMQDVWDQENVVYEDMKDNLADIVNNMEDGEIVKVFREAGLRAKTRTAYHRGDYTQLRQDLFNMIEDEDELVDGYTFQDKASLEESLLFHLISENEDVQAALEAVHESRPDFMRVPQVFTFKENRFDGFIPDVDGAVNPMIMGRYRVAEVRMHRLDDDVRRENPRIRAWKEVILERVTDDDPSWKDIPRIDGHNHP